MVYNIIEKGDFKFEDVADLLSGKEDISIQGKGYSVMVGSCIDYSMLFFLTILSKLFSGHTRSLHNFMIELRFL
jgi:hypothetical protein